MKKATLIVGARPNFMKMAPLFLALEPSRNIKTLLLHTGQHYDFEMSQCFFEEFSLPEPQFFLGVGSGTHGEQTGKIIIESEKLFLRERPDLVVVFGDVNSTLACCLAAKKLGILIAHVEAGLRSFDMSMPEEINRKLTDAISDILFTSSKDGNSNLLREGINKAIIYLVGNIMIDSLVKIMSKIDEDYQNKTYEKYGLNNKHYILVTLHRPSNVDREGTLKQILLFLNNMSGQIPVVFSMHPRTKKNLDRFELNREIKWNENFKMTAPMNYKEFIALEESAAIVVTDSGGIQEETTFLDVPCLTLRPNTERPITITKGTNELVDLENIEQKVNVVLSGKRKKGRVPLLWDGRAAERIANIIHNYLS